MCRCVLLPSFPSLESTGIKVDVRSFILWTNFESLSSLSNSNTYIVHISIMILEVKETEEKFLPVSRREKYFSNDEPISKRQPLLLYIYSLIRVVCFECLRSTHTYTFLGRNGSTMDSCDSSRSAKIEGKIALSWTFCIDMWNWGEKTSKENERSLPRFTISNLFSSF